MPRSLVLSDLAFALTKLLPDAVELEGDIGRSQIARGLEADVG